MIRGISKKMKFKSMVQENINTHYEFGKTLGSGAFGTVKVVRLWEDQRKIFALKSIKRDMFLKKDKKGEDEEEGMSPTQMMKLLETEIRVVMEMDHPNIVKFYQCVYDNQYINIIMELVRGIPLLDYL